MSELNPNTPGAFCWVELSTSDRPAAKTFYNTVFGWDYNDVPMPDGAHYTMAGFDDGMLGGVWELNAEMRQMNIPPHWASYVNTSDVDASAAKAKELGATIVKEPFDVMENGRMAVMLDPTGAPLSLWQPKGDESKTLHGTRHGLWGWNELMTNNVDRAGTFYGNLFGWTPSITEMADGTKYTTFMLGDKRAGGMMEIQKDWGDVPSHWALYFSVDDCDATLAKIKENGGTAIFDAMDIPNVGKFAALKDPQGAAFSIMQWAHP